MGVTYQWGFYSPPVPITATDKVKAEAPLISAASFEISEANLNCEIVRARADFDTSGAGYPSSCTFKWYNVDTGTLLFTYTYYPPAGYGVLYAFAWIGHLPSGEIDKAGNYKVVISAPGYTDKTFTFVITAPAPPPPPPNQHTVRFTANFAAGSHYTRSSYYSVDGGAQVFIMNIGDTMDHTFTAVFTQSIRVWVLFDAATTYNESLYVDGTLVASGIVGAEGLTYPAIAVPATFAIQSFSFFPAAIDLNGSSKATIVIKNTSAVAGSYKCEVLIEGPIISKLLNTFGPVGVSPGASTTSYFTWIFTDVPAGSHNIRVRVFNPTTNADYDTKLYLGAITITAPPVVYKILPAPPADFPAKFLPYYLELDQACFENDQEKVKAVLRKYQWEEGSPIVFVAALALIVKAVTVIAAVLGSYGFASFMIEEALQTIDMAEYTAMQSKQYDLAQLALNKKKEILQPTQLQQILSAIPVVNLIAALNVYFDASKAKMAIDQELINRKTEVLLAPEPGNVSGYANALEQGLDPSPFAPKKYSAIEIDPNVPGGTVLIDSMGWSAIFPFSLEIAPGTYTVEVRSEGFKTVTESIVINPYEMKVYKPFLASLEWPEELEKEIVVPLEKKPSAYNAWKYTLKTVAKATGAELPAKIFINGEDTGKWTPYYFYFEPEKSYILRFERWGYIPVEMTETTPPLPVL